MSGRTRISSVRLTTSESDNVVVYSCPWCNQGIRKRLDGPIVSAPSLGEGIYHFNCATAKWAALRKEEVVEDRAKVERREQAKEEAFRKKQEQKRLQAEEEQRQEEAAAKDASYDYLNPL